MSAGEPTPVLLIRAGDDGTPYFEAKWRDAARQQVKRRLGPAWLDPDGEGGWVKRRGRVPEGWLDEARAHVAAAEKVAEVEREREEAALAREREQVPTFRRVAHEWMAWRRDVKGGAPATLESNETLLREPGAPHKRGKGRSKGRIMKRFGDRPLDEVETRDVSAFLRELDAEGLSPSNVNKHRALLHAIFAYAMRPDTYELESNPVTGTDKRYEPEPEALDHYEVHEVEALAAVCERGGQRGRPRNYKGRPALLSDEEQAAQRAENQQDADLFRVKFYAGLRLGEIVALRWRDVQVLADLSGGILHVEHAVSARVEKKPKSGKARAVPIPQPAAQALTRLGEREDFTDADDYVFCNRLGQRLDPSAIRRRYKRAARAAGLRPVKLHGLRHAAGSVLARSLPLVTVRDVLGHAKLTTTNRYLHSKVDAAAIAAVNAAFGVRTESPAA